MATITDSALEKVSGDVMELVREHLPILADRMRQAGNDQKHRGSTVITIEMVDDPGNDKRSPQTQLVVRCKTSLPTETLDSRKVVWENGQMELL